MRDRGIGFGGAGGLLLATILLATAGCSATSELGAMIFADPGKYQYRTCDEIVKAAQVTAARQKTLRELIDKAEQGAGGAFVSTIAYRGEYRTVTEELVVIEETARAKNCLTSSTWRSQEAIQ
jgi:hypothetical protein